MKNTKKMKTLKLRNLKQIIRESLRKVLNEGIDFDESDLTVAYNPTHENNVETSEETNPTMVHKFLENVEIWSIFKRKAGTFGDGNPLIYAFKNEHGWKFRSDEDKNAILAQIDKIITKFFEIKQTEVTVVLPSIGPLNTLFASMISKHTANSETISNIFVKMSVEEVRNMILESNSFFRQAYNSHQLFNAALASFDKSARKMGTYYRTHLMMDNDIRRIVEQTIKINDEFIGAIMDKIDGKNILVIDDNIGFGSSIKASLRQLTSCYNPKSITFLTLFSEKYDSDGKQIRRPPLNLNKLRKNRLWNNR